LSATKLSVNRAVAFFGAIKTFFRNPRSLLFNILGGLFWVDMFRWWWRWRWNGAVDDIFNWFLPVVGNEIASPGSSPCVLFVPLEFENFGYIIAYGFRSPFRLNFCVVKSCNFSPVLLVWADAGHGGDSRRDGARFIRFLHYIGWGPLILHMGFSKWNLLESFKWYPQLSARELPLVKGRSPLSFLSLAASAGALPVRSDGGALLLSKDHLFVVLGLQGVAGHTAVPPYRFIFVLRGFF
jgi:hypothetical protein